MMVVKVAWDLLLAVVISHNIDLAWPYLLRRGRLKDTKDLQVFRNSVVLILGAANNMSYHSAGVVPMLFATKA